MEDIVTRELHDATAAKLQIRRINNALSGIIDMWASCFNFKRLVARTVSPCADVRERIVCGAGKMQKERAESDLQQSHGRASVATANSDGGSSHHSHQRASFLPVSNVEER